MRITRSTSALVAAIVLSRAATADQPDAGNPKAAAKSAAAPTIPLQAIEPSKAAFPLDSSETLSVVTGNLPAYAFAHGSGYVKAPLARVLAALRQPDVLIDKRRVDQWKVDPAGEPVPLTFRVHNTVHSGAIVVEFDMTWHEGVVEGTTAKPRLIVARSLKTAGSTMIGVLEESITARPVDADSTSIELVRHLKGMNVGTKEAEQYLRDVFANVVARAHGKDLPKYR